MAFNGAGVFNRLYSWVQDAINGIKIRADRMDAEDNGFATGLTDCVTRDGQSPALTDLPMGGHRHINAAVGTAVGQYLTYGQDNALLGITTFHGATEMDAVGNIGVGASVPGSTDAIMTLGGGMCSLGSVVLNDQAFYGGNVYRDGVNWKWATGQAGWCAVRMINGIIQFHTVAGASPGTGTIIANMDTTALKALIDGAGNYYPGSDNAQSLGLSSNRWSVVYAGTGTINTSALEAKTNIREVESAEIATAKILARSVRVYQFLDAVAKKEAGARLHMGLIYEEVVAAFEENNLDPMRYGIVCRDEGSAGLRYDELAQFVLCGLNARLEMLEATERKMNV